MADNSKGLVVLVPAREGFNGFFSAGEHWPAGATVVEVVADKAAKDAAAKEGKRAITAEQKAVLEGEPKHLLSLMTASDAAKATGIDPAGMAQDEDERKMLEAHRKAKAEKSAQQKK
jgi:hypothetical protein